MKTENIIQVLVIVSIMLIIGCFRLGYLEIRQSKEEKKEEKKEKEKENDK